MTPQQKRLLDFIDARQSETGICPSYDEMRAHMGLASKDGIRRLVNGLEAHGKIKRRPDWAMGSHPCERNHRWSPEARQRAAERMRALNADPEFKARAAERMRALHADPEFKAKQCASRWHCPGGYEALYRKAASIIGAKDAREQIEAMALADAERATSQDVTVGGGA